MLCPVVFSFERIVYFEKRPDIFGNDSLFRRDSSRQKLSKSYHLVKIGNLVKIFALTSYLKENHIFFEKITDYQHSCPVNDMVSTRLGKDI